MFNYILFIKLFDLLNFNIKQKFKNIKLYFY